jgi:hypothetical protein
MKPAQIEALVDYRVKKRLEKERIQIERMTIAHVTMTYHMALLNKFDWDSEKVNGLIQYANETFKLVSEKYLTMDDIKEWLIENNVKGIMDV